MRKFVIYSMFMLLTFCFTGLVHATPRVVLDGQTLAFDVPPVNQNGTLLVPLRGVFETLDAEVTWEASTQTVTAIKGNKIITLVIGQSSATINGNSYTLEVPAKIVDGYTLVPLRFVSESLGADVEWNEVTHTVTITSNQPLNKDDKTFEQEIEGKEPHPPTSTATKNPPIMVGISKVPYVMSDRKGAVLGAISLVEDDDFKEGFFNGDEFEVSLPKGVEFAENTSVRVTCDGTTTYSSDVLEWSITGKSTIRICLIGLEPDRKDTIVISVVADLHNYKGDIKAKINAWDSSIPSGTYVIGVAR